jgi:hypothetical protein
VPGRRERTPDPVVNINGVHHTIDQGLTLCQEAYDQGLFGKGSAVLTNSIRSCRGRGDMIDTIIMTFISLAGLSVLG